MGDKKLKLAEGEEKGPPPLRLVGAGGRGPVVNRLPVRGRARLQPLMRQRKHHLNGGEEAPRGPVEGVVAKKKQRRVGEPITDVNDPRWVLATRAASMLEGSLLSLERRNRLMKLGRLLGLTAFDTNLIIAIVQDQARRGFSAEYCPTAGEPQLRMVPVPDLKAKQTKQNLATALGIAVLIFLELAAINWLLTY